MNINVLMLLTNAFDPDPRVHREAAALVQAGYNVTILCWDRDRKAPVSEVVDGICVRRIYVRSTHGRGSSQAFFLLLFWIRALFATFRDSYQVIHAHDFDTLPLGYVLARWKRAKLVYDAHESYVDMLHTLPAPMKTAIMNAENLFLRRTHLVITVGELLRAELARRGAHNTSVVGNWQDPARFRFDPQKLTQERMRLGIPPDRKIVSYIANLGPERQLMPLIEAVGGDPQWHLIIAGDGPLGYQARQASTTYPNVTYLGRVHPSLIPLYTAMADVIYYGFDPNNPNARFSAPNKLFEALAAAKPILTGAFGEIGLIVQKERCGILMSDYSSRTIRNALTRAASDIFRLSAKSARVALEHYNWKQASRVLVEHYQYLSS